LKYFRKQGGKHEKFLEKGGDNEGELKKGTERHKPFKIQIIIG
jgi:hypothetical protein